MLRWIIDAKDKVDVQILLQPNFQEYLSDERQRAQTVSMSFEFVIGVFCVLYCFASQGLGGGAAFDVLRCGHRSFVGGNTSQVRNDTDPQLPVSNQRAIAR